MCPTWVVLTWGCEAGGGRDEGCVPGGVETMSLSGSCGAAVVDSVGVEDCANVSDLG